jgi:hypothetical protein
VSCFTSQSPKTGSLPLPFKSPARLGAGSRRRTAPDWPKLTRLAARKLGRREVMELGRARLDLAQALIPYPGATSVLLWPRNHDHSLQRGGSCGRDNRARAA